MAYPTLLPVSSVSAVILPATGTVGDVASALALNIYGDTNSYLYSVEFLSGAADQVAYTYQKLAGNVLDIELTAENVYNTYEEACLEYSYILNIHQAKNSLSSILGSPTASFDQDGKITSSLSGSHVNLKYPKFNFSYGKRVSEGVSHIAGVGGTEPIYSASVYVTGGVQDYDLQAIVSQSAAINSSLDFYGKVTNKRIYVHKVFYKTGRAMWRFYGYYGGLNTVGNLSYYGQYADDSTWEVVPVWQNRLQASAYEEAIYVRNSHYSYELKNNMLRLFPVPQTVGDSTIMPDRMWFLFSLPSVPYEADPNFDNGTSGVNNMGTLPFDPIPYGSINSIGKQWIRRYALSCAKEVLGQVRGKFNSVPIPGDSVTLNYAELLSQSKEEKKELREELQQVLDQLTYAELAKRDAEIADSTSKTLEKVPNLIYLG